MKNSKAIFIGVVIAGILLIAVGVSYISYQQQQKAELKKETTEQSTQKKATPPKTLYYTKGQTIQKPVTEQPVPKGLKGPSPITVE